VARLRPFLQEGTMLSMAISVLWMLVGVVILCAVVWFVFYILETVMLIAIPDRIKQMVWLVILILVIIAILTILAGGTFGGIHMPRA
jgi:hypothetical protein